LSAVPVFLCSVCGDRFDDAAGGGEWNGEMVCAGCEQRTLGPAIDAMTAITSVLEEAGLPDADVVAGDVYAAIIRSGCLIVGLDELAERNAAFRLEIEDLRAELGR
jgi:uncharacterized small protein (DUF1192 family)